MIVKGISMEGFWDIFMFSWRRERKLTYCPKQQLWSPRCENVSSLALFPDTKDLRCARIIWGLFLHTKNKDEKTNDKQSNLYYVEENSPAFWNKRGKECWDIYSVHGLIYCVCPLLSSPVPSVLIVMSGPRHLSPALSASLRLRKTGWTWWLFLS